MMKDNTIFALRDDDISYFTNPVQLERIYHKIWNKVPVSFAVIPFIHPSARFVSRPNYDDKRYPIGGNKPLVRLLKKKIRQKRVSIMLHGYSHRWNENGHEFEIDNDLEKKTREGKRYLETLFNIKIKTFVAPNHALSKKGMEAIISNKLNLVGAPQIRKRPLFYKKTYIINIMKLLLFRLRNSKEIRYPFPIDFDTHKEIYCYGLVPDTEYSELLKGMHFAYKNKGIFCLAYHSNVLDEKMTKTLRDIIKDADRIGVKYELIDSIL